MMFQCAENDPAVLKVEDCRALATRSISGLSVSKNIIAACTSCMLCLLHDCFPVSKVFIGSALQQEMRAVGNLDVISLIACLVVLLHDPIEE